jgi:CHAD domain-containing protein
MKKINWAEELKKSISKILRQGIEEINNSEKNIDVLIHDSRKRVKNIRALLKLIQDELTENKFKEFNNSLRNLNRNSAAVRRSYVMLKIIENELKSNTNIPNVRLLEYLKSIIEERMVISQPKISTNQLLTQYSDYFHFLAKYLGNVSLNKMEFTLIRTGLERIYDTAKNCSQISRKKHDVILYHELRKNIKDLSYVLEIIQIGWPSIIKSYNKQLKILAEIIGEMHDLHEFKAMLSNSKVPIGMKKAAIEVHNEIQQRINSLIIVSDEITVKIFAEKTKCFVSRLEIISSYKYNKPKIGLK